MRGIDNPPNSCYNIPVLKKWVEVGARLATLGDEEKTARPPSTEREFPAVPDPIG